ncbi:MAG: MFS transporter, partial [Phycisphaerales bacterium]|nr:MFS transporter [Phycisphaerales bacterium]
FLQFFLWGAWFVTLGPFMASRGMGGSEVGTWIGHAYSTAPIAAIIAPFFLGIVADRFFASQRLMGYLHTIGGVLLMFAPWAAMQSPEKPVLFFVVLLAHMLCYMPTLGLSNTVAFNCMSNPEKQFPIVRVWGTIGWIVAGLIVGFAAKQFIADVAPTGTMTAADAVAATEAARNASPQFFYIAGASGILLGLFSFFLPSTPPPAKGKPFSVGSIIGIDSLRLFKDRSFAVFAVCSLLICIPLAAYYSLAGVYVGASGIENVPFKMTFGQMSEIAFMVVMPLFFARLGVKWMLAIGMLAWVVRYGLFAGAWGSAGPSEDLKWMVLGGIILHGICYDFFFVTGQIYVERAAGPAIRGQAQGFLVLLTQGVGMLIGNQVIGRLKDHYTVAGVTDWRAVWQVPAVFAAVILVIFVVLFRNPPAPKTE